MLEASNGRNSPVCVLFIKMVIHFRDFGNFKNGIMKTEPLFLDNFVGRVRIWNTILLISYHRPPWGAGGKAYMSAIVE